MNTWTHRTMIVPAAFQQLAAALTAGIAGSSGTGMFTTPAGPSPDGPTTHYSSSGRVFDTFAALMPLDELQTDEQGSTTIVRVQPGQAETIVAAAAAAGSPVPLATIQALLAAVIVTAADGWQSTYAAAGLHQVQDSDVGNEP